METTMAIGNIGIGNTSTLATLNNLAPSASAFAAASTCAKATVDKSADRSPSRNTTPPTSAASRNLRLRWVGREGDGEL